MKFLSLLLIALLVAYPAAPVAAQQQQAKPTAPQQDEDDTVRITTNLVQIDVIVTGKDGRQITDLRPEDFSVLQDGKEQQITNFSYVSTTGANASPPSAAAAPPARPAAKSDSPLPSVQPRRGQIRRTIALIVDDLRMSFSSVEAVRTGIRKFIEERTEPGDLVGIFRTRGGSGALQQFTSDRVQLRKAIDRVRWLPSPLGGAGIDVYEPERADYTLKSVKGQGGATSFESKEARERRERNEERAREIEAHNALGALQNVVRAMKSAPGRRSVVMLADGLPIFSRRNEIGRSFEDVKRVIEAANRASVVVYTVDARGLFNSSMISAADEVLPENTQRVHEERENAYRGSQEGFNTLAAETGGLFIHSVNGIDRALARVLADQSGYYLIGYRPSEETFAKGAKNFRLSVRVKRPGIEVRTRSGFEAIANNPSRVESSGDDRPLYSVLASPIAAGDVGMRMTAGFFDTPAPGVATARILLHIEGKSLSFTDEPNGRKKLALDVAAVTLDLNGKVMDEFNRTHTVRTSGPALEVVQANGLSYTADIPVKKPGTYQLRVVVRDQASQRIGSASQLIEVPDLKRKNLAVSTVTLRQADDGGAGASQAETAPVTAESALDPVLSPSNSAVRRFNPGATLAYSYRVYNAAFDPSTRQPRLTAQTRLYRNGQLVAEGQPATLAPVADGTARIQAAGVLPLAANAAPGEYVLQIVVTDTLNKERRQATQWIDFEVVR